MKKNVAKIAIILVLVMIMNVLNICNNKIYAVGDITENLDKWKPTTATSNDTGKLTEKVNGIVGTVRTIGIIVSVATLSIIGIKYMLGSVEEKAQYKQILLPWIVGAIMVFAITTIPTLIYEMSTEMFGTSSNRGGGGAGGTGSGTGGGGIGSDKEAVQLH